MITKSTLMTAITIEGNGSTKLKKTKLISSGGIIFEILSDTIIRKLFMYLPVLLLMYKDKTTMYATVNVNGTDLKSRYYL